MANIRAPKPVNRADEARIRGDREFGALLASPFWRIWTRPPLTRSSAGCIDARCSARSEPGPPRGGDVEVVRRAPTLLVSTPPGVQIRERSRLMMRYLASVTSVVLGFVVVVALSMATDFVLERTGVFPTGSLWDTGLLLLALAYRSVYGVLGGYVTARLAPHHRMAHALALGVLGLAVSVFGAVMAWNLDLGPAWYALFVIGSAIPCAWYGARLASGRV